MRRIFLDTEFHEYKKQHKVLGMPIGPSVDTIELISIGLVDEEGEECYLVSKDFDVDAAWANEWLRENVLKEIFDELKVKEYGGDIVRVFEIENFKDLLNEFALTEEEIRESIISFVREDNPHTELKFYSYYADYDWVVFCWLFGRMIDLPEGFPMYCVDLMQRLDSIGSPSVRHLKSENEHNALDDAKYHRRIWLFIEQNKVYKEECDRLEREKIDLQVKEYVQNAMKLADYGKKILLKKSLQLFDPPALDLMSIIDFLRKDMEENGDKYKR